MLQNNVTPELQRNFVTSVILRGDQVEPERVAAVESD
jgi:(2Fe-2S) ferredoxin